MFLLCIAYMHAHMQSKLLWHLASCPSSRKAEAVYSQRCIAVVLRFNHGEYIYLARGVRWKRHLFQMFRVLRGVPRGVLCGVLCGVSSSHSEIESTTRLNLMEEQYLHVDTLTTIYH